MRWNKNWQVEGKHAYLGASKYHWIRYDLEKMERIWANKFASERGTRLHRIAAELIKEGIRMPRDEQTLNRYVNDAIGFRMTPELVLMFNEDFFGTADACSFEKGILRVHDLKTGVHPGAQDQIMIYFALFCLEYGHSPYDIEMIGRIYQNDAVVEFRGEPKEVQEIMQKGTLFAKRIQEMKDVLL